MKTNIKFNKIVNLFCLLVVVVGVLFGVLPKRYVAKAEGESSAVLVDLQKDKSFNTADYPVKENDYSLDVIQLAEGVDGELFVYVYQPSGDTKILKATTLRMSMPSVGVDAEWKDYKLNFLNREGVFQKYQVEGVEVKKENVRYYDITAIHRAFDKSVDEVPATNTEQVVNEVAFEVAQLWTATTDKSGNVTYICDTTEVINITVKICGYIRYLDGYFLVERFCDSHFVAFDTAREIEDLLEADISFVSQTYKHSDIYLDFDLVSPWTYGDKIAQTITIESTQTGSNKGEGLFGKKHEWARIEKAEDFAKNSDINFTAGGLEDLKSAKWVVRFTDVDYKRIDRTTQGFYEEGTFITDVSVLRLKFITDGITYNLGVVDNKQTGDKAPLGKGETELEEFFEEPLSWLKIGLYVLLAIVFIVAFVLVVNFLRWTWDGLRGGK